MKLSVRPFSPLVLAVFLSACGPAMAPAPDIPGLPAGHIRISVVGTNDLHGHLRALPILGAYVSTLRGMRAQDGALLLLDGGDMFQGTLESNLFEGAPIVRAYEALGYDAVAIGNHEFDYGPAGPRSVVQTPEDDPRGALLARVAQAPYPFLNANLLRLSDGAPIEWPGVLPSVRLERAGISIGVIGVTTESTLVTTLSANVADLRMESLSVAIAREAQRLRAEGVSLVLVAAHAGGHCEEFGDPEDLSSCDESQEIFEVVRALPRGAIDLVVAGHTHRAVAHRVAGVPIIESYALGRAFGRVDFILAPHADGDQSEGGHAERGHAENGHAENGQAAGARVVDVQIFPPQDLCREGSAADGDCVMGPYEGRALVVDEAVARAISPAIASAAARRERPLGVELSAEVTRSRVGESAEGNLFTDLMRAHRPEVDVALLNGGGLRAPLPAGNLTYGQLYEAMPFDNRFALMHLSAAELSAALAHNLGRQGGIFSLSGLRAEAQCVDGELQVRLTRDAATEGGAREVVPPGTELTLLTTDYLASRPGGAFTSVQERQGGVQLEEGPLIRDVLATELSERGGVIDPDALYRQSAPRFTYEGTRPLDCPAPAPQAGTPLDTSPGPSAGPSAEERATVAAP